MKLITIHPHRESSFGQDQGEDGQEGEKRGAQEEQVGGMGRIERGGKEDFNLECAEGNIEGAKQRQVKESGGSYRKERVGCVVDDGGKSGGERHKLVGRMLGGMKHGEC